MPVDVGKAEAEAGEVNLPGEDHSAKKISALIISPEQNSLPQNYRRNITPW